MPTDIEAINIIVDEWAAAVSAGDADRLIQLFTDDVITLPPDLPMMTGKAAFKKWAVDDWFTPFELTEELVLDELDIAGTWALGLGHFTLEAVPKDGTDKITFTGKYLAKFARDVNGSWKWSRVSFNWDSRTEVHEARFQRQL